MGGGSGPLTPLDPPLSSLLMKPQVKIDKIYLSVFEEMIKSQMKNEPHLIFPTFNDQIHLVVRDYLNTYSNMSSLTLNGETITRQRIASHLGPHLGHVLWGLILIILLLDMRSMTLHGEHYMLSKCCVM